MTTFSNCFLSKIHSSYFVVLLLFFIPFASIGQYSTPGTGINWNMDSLVVHSNGAVTGVGDLYEISEQLTLSLNDSLIITSPDLIVVSPEIDIYFHGYIEINNPSGLIITPVFDTYFGVLYFEEESSAILKHVTIEYGGGIKVFTPYFEMDSCTVRSLHYSEDTSGSLEIINGKPIIKNSTFISNDHAAIFSSIFSEVAPIIENNSFLYNVSNNVSLAQIHLGPSGPNDTTKILNNSIFGHPTSDFAAGLTYSSNPNVEGGNIIIADNEIQNNRFGVAINGNSTNVLIHNNSIHNNTSPEFPITNGVGIFLNDSYSDSMSLAILSANEIYENYSGIIVGNNIHVNLGDGTVESPGLNIFYDNEYLGEVSALENTSSFPISALNNCWDGLQNITLEEAEDVIFHQEDDASLGLVSFDPMWNCGAGVGIDEMDGNQPTIYPNPAINEIVIRSDTQVDEFKIYTITGQLIKSGIIRMESPTRLNINDLESGIYLIELTDGEAVSWTKFIKE